jgi:RimJ/RimL family protein N-acetyltransferase
VDDMTLREMTVDDLDRVVEVQREAAVVALAHIFPQDRHPFPTERVRARWAAEIADPAIDCFVVVAPDGGVGGFAATHDEEFMHFGTALAAWGSGLAGQAHDAVLAHMRDRGRSRAWLRVLEENHRARRFYERRGWTPLAERSASPHAPYPALVHYERDLGGDHS